MVKVIDVEGQLITICADTDEIRPYKPCVFFIHLKCDIKIVFDFGWQQSEAYGNSEWCNKMSIKLIEMVEMAGELVKQDENELF